MSHGHTVSGSQRVLRPPVQQTLSIYVFMFLWWVNPIWKKAKWCESIFFYCLSIFPMQTVMPSQGRKKVSKQNMERNLQTCCFYSNACSLKTTCFWFSGPKIPVNVPIEHNLKTWALPACRDFPRSPVSWGGTEPGRPSRSCQSWCSRSLDSSQLSYTCSPPGSGWGGFFTETKPERQTARREEKKKKAGHRPRYDSAVIYLSCEKTDISSSERSRQQDPGRIRGGLLEERSNSPRVWAVPTQERVQLAGQEVEIGWGETTTVSHLAFCRSRARASTLEISSPTTTSSPLYASAPHPPSGCTCVFVLRVWSLTTSIVRSHPEMTLFCLWRSAEWLTGGKSVQANPPRWGFDRDAPAKSSQGNRAWWRIYTTKMWHI